MKTNVEAEHPRDRPSKRVVFSRVLLPVHPALLRIAVLIALWGGFAQLSPGEIASLPRIEVELPDAPGFAWAAQSAPQTAGSGSISGTVLDISEAVVAGAHVTLADQSGAAERVVISGISGEFSFAGLAAGVFRITIVSPGLETFVSTGINLGAGQRHVLERIALPLASASSSVDVTVTEQELATEQVQAEVKQRVLGVFPNFYTSYIWNAAPLTPRLKFKLALRATTDPVILLTTGVRAGIEQLNNTYPGYGDGAEGYAKRYGAAYATSITGRFLGSAILPSIFHQDPRYFYRGSGSIGSRALYALSSAVICRGDNGRWQPNYSHVGGNFAAAAISNLYHPSQDRGVDLVLHGGLLNLAANAGSNLLREFISRPFTTNVPAFAKGK